jgi:hypothetical protein
MRFDAEYLPGARNAIDTCLRIQPHEKVTLITDVACLKIAEAFRHELAARELNFRLFVLEELAAGLWRACPRRCWKTWKPAR